MKTASVQLHQLLCPSYRSKPKGLFAFIWLSGVLGLLSLRAADPQYTFTTIAGTALSGFGSADGTGSAARFRYPKGVAVDSAGNIYVSDSGNNTIRKGVPSITSTTSPRLQITRSGGQVLLSWPTNSTTFALVSTTNLGSPNWTNVAVTPNLNGGSYSVALPGTGSVWYFQLQGQ